jgi:hypothetical protein
MVSADRANGRLLVAWSEGPVGQTANSIHFSAIDAMPDSKAVNMILRANARYELDDDRQTAVYLADSRLLRLTGRASAGLEIPNGLSELRFHASGRLVRPGAVLATFGDYLHFAVVRAGADGSALEVVEFRRTDRGVLEEVAKASRKVDESADRRFSIVVDPEGAKALVDGRPFAFERPPSAFFGDGFLAGSAKPTDTQEFDMASGVAFRCSRAQATLETCVDRAR